MNTDEIMKLHNAIVGAQERMLKSGAPLDVSVSIDVNSDAPPILRITYQLSCTIHVHTGAKRELRNFSSFADMIDTLNEMGRPKAPRLLHAD